MKRSSSEWALRASFAALAALALASACADFLPGGRSFWEAADPDRSRAYGLLSDEGSLAVLGWWARAARSTLLGAVFASAAGVLLGGVLAVLAALGPPMVDALLRRFVELSSTMPGVIALSLAYARFGPRLEVLVAVIVWMRTAEAARVLRGRLSQLNAEDFSTAAVAIGAPPGRLVIRHFLPHLASPAAVSLFTGAAAAVGLESAAGFLGLAPPSIQPTWGEALGQAPRSGQALLALWAFAGVSLSLGSLWVIARHLEHRPRVVPRNL